MAGRLAVLFAATVLALLPVTAAFPENAGHVNSDKESTKSEGTEYDSGRMAEAVDLRSVLAALGLLSGTFLAVLLGLRVYLHCLRRRPQRESRRKKMTEEEIDQRFPVMTPPESEQTCVVCLCTIEADDKCRVTQCGHAFHADCLVAWWLHKPKRILRCPICRTRQRVHNKKSKVSAEEDATCPACPEAADQEHQQSSEMAGEAGQEQEEQGRESHDREGDHQQKYTESEASPCVSIVVAESPAVGVVVDSPHGDSPMTEGIPLGDHQMHKPQAGVTQVMSV